LYEKGKLLEFTLHETLVYPMFLDFLVQNINHLRPNKKLKQHIKNHIQNTMKSKRKKTGKQTIFPLKKTVLPLMLLVAETQVKSNINE
jgi:hypothetical protein